MGDGSLVLELIWNNLFNAIVSFSKLRFCFMFYCNNNWTHMLFALLQAQKPSLHNMNGLLRIIVTLDAGTSKLMNGNVVKLIAGYLVDASLVRTFFFQF
jgi:pre-rRNA-processing protein IPI1